MQTAKKAALETGPETRKQLITEAIGYLSNALTIYPDFYQVQDELGSLYYHNRQYDEAAAHELQALHNNPYDTFAINILSKAYFKKQLYDSAVKYNHIALSFTDDKSGYCIRIGACYAYMGNNDSAVAYMLRATTLDPEDNTAYLNLAGIYKNLNQPDSVQKYQHLAEHAPKKSIPMQ
jgi:tetratricopeptide (TPR) repeat protein